MLPLLDVCNHHMQAAIGDCACRPLLPCLWERLVLKLALSFTMYATGDATSWVLQAMSHVLMVQLAIVMRRRLVRSIKI